MGDLFWPGDDRAGDLMSGPTFLAALVEVERAWLSALVTAGIAPATARHDLADLVDPDDLPDLSTGAESGGNPVIPLISLLRKRVDAPDAARWLHRGLTSQDVVDTALVLCARDAFVQIGLALLAQVEALTTLAGRHRRTPMVGRTLTQHAVPTTFGLKVCGWLSGVLDGYDEVRSLTFPAQIGGAAGTLSGVVELGGQAAARACVAAVTHELRLTPTPPWHTTRTPLTRFGDVAVRCTDAWGRIAEDVLVLSRPELGELSEGSGGGSSTMPHKSNPVLSTLLRRAALAAPPLAATLHLAAAGQVDERADGAWHVEWPTLAALVRRTVIAASQATELIAGLQVHPERMRTTLEAATEAVRSEQYAMAELAGHQPAESYLGLADDLMNSVLARAKTAMNGGHR